MPERISVDAQEFKAFLAESQQLLQLYEKLLDKATALESRNRELEEKLRLAEEKQVMMENQLAGEVSVADETLRKLRATMARLMERTDHEFLQ